MKIIAFSGKREDYNTAKQLQDGKIMITPPRERRIHKSIKNLSTYSSNQNVEKLLTIASANQYGLRANSALRQYMEENSTLKGEIFENNYWDLELQNATQKAINKLPKTRREKFLKKYNEIFLEPQNLTPIEKKIIRYRENILNSKPMQMAMNDKTQAKAVSKSMMLLDYFVASSETPMKEKAYVLLKLSHLMSDAYSIHPQLKDKKFKVFSEIINDLVIKLPNKDVLTTKDCSQEKHGSCGATSIARKALLYEDKVAYINMLLSELDDKTYMDIYDVTRLLEYQKDSEKYETLRAPKVRVDKAQINYERAIYEGYRIIDAAALNWMKIAGTVGDGTLSLQDYIAFDARHNGLFFDSRILTIEDEDYAAQHSYLRTLIKSLELLKSYNSICIKEKIKNNQVPGADMVAGRDYAIKKKNFIDEIKKISPDVSQEQVSLILSKSLDVLNINTSNNASVLASQINKLFKTQLGEKYLFAVDEKSPVIDVVKQYVKASKKVSDSKNDNVNLSFMKNKKLFEIGLAQREFLLTQLKSPDMDKNMYYDEYKLPNYHTQVKQRIRKLIKLAKIKPQSPVILELQKKHNLDNKGLQEFLVKLHEDVAENLFLEIDKHLAFYDMSYKDILLNGLQKRLLEHRNGSTDFMYAVSDKVDIRPDSKKFDKFLVKVIENLKNATTYEQIEESIRPLGSQDPFETIKVMVDVLVKALDEKIQQGGFSEIIDLLKLDKNLSEDELLAQINSKNAQISKLLNLVYVAADVINFPDEESLIIKLSETKSEILTKEEIELLKNKFDKISKERNKVATLREQGHDVKLNNNIFKFTKEEKALLNKIEKAIPQFARVTKREYGTLNKLMSDRLGKLYSDLGKRTGHFWIREEGESGLMPNEMVRVLEQMTGRPYHLEFDFDEVINHIQSGKGSGISATHVSWDEAGGHAQYIADVGTIKVKNPKTGKEEEKTVMLHDNTWGHAEMRTQWIDEYGVKRTDYNRGFGPKEGFVVMPSLLTGTTVEHFKYDQLNESSKVYKKAIDGPASEIMSSFSIPIFQEVCLPGIDSRIDKKLNKVLHYLLAIGGVEEEVQSFFELIQKPENKLWVDFLNKFDKLIDDRQEVILNRIVRDEKPQITLAQYNNLPQNDELKIIIEKLILVKSFEELVDSESVNTAFGNIKTHKALENFKQKKLEEYKDAFRGLAFKKRDKAGEKVAIQESTEEIINIIKKIEEEKNIKLKELKKAIKPALETAFEKEHSFVLDNLLTNVFLEVEKALKSDINYKKLDKTEVSSILLCASDVVEECYMFGNLNEVKGDPCIGKFITFLDNKFKPTDDEDLVNTHRYLMRWNQEEFEELIKDMTFEDIGVKFDTPENVIRLIQSGNELEQKRLDKITFDHFYDEVMKPAMRTSTTNANVLYRNLYVALSSFLDEKFINKYKNWYFRKYKVRPAIPNVEVKSKAELVHDMKPLIESLQSSAIELKSLRKGRNSVFALQQLSYLMKNNDIYDIREELIFNLNTLLKEIETDKNCQNAVNISNKMLKRLSNYSYTKEQLDTDFNLLNMEMNRILGGASIESYKAEFARAKSVFTNNIDFIVRANVLPQYQSIVRRLFYKWAELVSKENPDLEKTTDALKLATVTLLTHHVLTKPAELLSYAVKFSAEKPQNMSDDVYNGILESLKGSLVESLKKVNKVKLEYKLMELAEKGNSSKIRDFLNNNVRTRSQQNFLETNGMAVIRAALQDPSNNNETLLLFVEQAGLIDDLMESIYKDDLKVYKRDIRKITIDTTNVIKSKVYLNAFFNEFLAQSENIKNPSKEDLSKALDSYLDSLLNAAIDKKYEKSVDVYWNRFKEIVQNYEIPQGAPLNSILANINESVMNDFEGGIQYASAQLNKILNSLYSNIDLLSSMKLLDNGTDEGKREAHIEKINKVIDYAMACGSYLSSMQNASFSLV